MLQLFRHQSPEQKANRIFAPVEGEVIDLIKVKDPVFSQHMLGQGFAVIPSDGIIYSPVSGQVTLVASTKHAIYLKMANGLDVLLHLGLDTADLKGRPFRVHVQDGQTIRGGQRIAVMNRFRINSARRNDVVVVVITNSAERLAKLDVKYGPVTGGRQIGQVTLKNK